jgi:hypothetical protein
MHYGKLEYLVFCSMELEHLKPKGQVNALFIQNGVSKQVNGGAN